MNEHDVIRFMKRFPDKINTGRRMMSRKWKCSTCGKEYRSETEIPNPAPCAECNGIFFEKINCSKE